MNAVEQSISRAIGVGAKRMQFSEIVSGTAINVTDTDCDVKRDNAATMLGVQLNAIDDNLQSFVTIVPKEGSEVIVGIIESNRADGVVLRCSEVEKVIAKIGSQTLNIDKNGFVFNGGDLGGLVKINVLEQKLNALVQAFNTHTHPVPGVTPGSGSTTSSVVVAQASQFSASDFEDNKIKH